MNYQSYMAVAYEMAIAYEMATLSDDPSNQVGAVVVNPRGDMVGMGWNQMVWSTFGTAEEDWERPRKYGLVCHAEESAIMDCSAKPWGLTMVSTWASCAPCARLIVQSGIECLVRHAEGQAVADDRWAESIALGDEILRAAGVEIVDLPMRAGVEIRRDGKLVRL